MHEQKIMRMATSEGGTPINDDYTPENMAEHKSKNIDKDFSSIFSMKIGISTMKQIRTGD